ncbi:MAG: hypothetical protein AB7F19_07675 [Candidatus Babeliales bacterium]
MTDKMLYDMQADLATTKANVANMKDDVMEIKTSISEILVAINDNNLDRAEKRGMGKMGKFMLTILTMPGLAAFWKAFFNH